MNLKSLFIFLFVLALATSCSGRQPGRLQIINRTNVNIYYKVIFEPNAQRLIVPAESPMLSTLKKGESVSWGLDMRNYKDGLLYIKLFKMDSVTSDINFIRDQVVSISSLVSDSAKPVIIERL